MRKRDELGREGGAHRVTTWEHYEEVRKINIVHFKPDSWRYLGNQIDFNFLFCSFSCLFTEAGNILHRLPSCKIWTHSWQAQVMRTEIWNYPLNPTRSDLSIGRDGWICAGGADEWRGGKKVKMLKITSPTHPLPCLAGLGPWILVKYIISCLFQIHNGRDRFYLVS